MRNRSGIGCAVVALLMFAAFRAVANDSYSLNRTVRLPRYGGRVGMGARVGPLVFTEIVVHNPPNAGDLRDARKDPNDNCHPKLALGVSNPGRVKMAFHVVVTLEDARGRIYMECDRDDTISPASYNDHTHLCTLSSMKTIDWPRLAVIRLKARAWPDR